MFECFYVNNYRVLKQRQIHTNLNHFPLPLSLKTEADGWGAEDDLNWEDENTW